MKQTMILAAALFFAAAPAGAQSLEFGGVVLDHDLMWATDMATLSQTHTFGTARTMGMGGAFVSLGADLTSMTLNPAGLGMYRRSEAAFTPFLSIAHAQTDGVEPWQQNNKSRFSFTNIGGAFNIVQNADKKLTSLTLGIAMNRVADFNTRYSYSSESYYLAGRPDHLMPTIADIFAQQLATFGVTPWRAGDDGSGNGPIFIGDWNPNVWPAILGYDAYMVNNSGTVDDPYWEPARIGANASVLHSLDVINTGSINEFDFSVGANFNNIVYIGATLGLQSVRKELEMTYQEEYGYFSGDPAFSNGTLLDEELLRSTLWQRTVVNGSGVNFKLGIIVRPITGLRIGLAFHSPTWYALDRSYQAGIEADIEQRASGNRITVGEESPQSTTEGTSDNWSFSSPVRLLLGASYAFGNVAVISMDYQCDWYNSMRVRRQPDFTGFDNDFYNNEFRNNFRGTNTVRAGLEIRPTPRFALRAGGGYTGSMLRDYTFNNDSYTGQPHTAESWYFSAGLGVTLSRTATLDFAYQHKKDQLSLYQFFFSRSEENNGPLYSDKFRTYSGNYNTQLTRHFVTMTLSFRF